MYFFLTAFFLSVGVLLVRSGGFMRVGKEKEADRSYKDQQEDL